MGLDGSLDGLSASMITTLDDTLRPFSQNYKVSVGREIPMVFLNHAQHRKKNLVRHTMLKSSNKLLKDLKKSVTLR
ncbi:(R)-2-hydroxyglutaryl-CoA dehydratase subunit beta [Peptoniphilus harei]|uniref:(R)-2-hydroxyglutaryl-CoA dehydratase subunit beta n=2 Tax=Peptoniphilus harei TaxID=54005 RepID=A0A2X1XA60_9FIRM|nr:hypothetical protein [Peptoniphilus harei]SPY40137.1 (R)-2-hydroxyglutaryl-CoA dehydratase subunit beta [Peptoniphilus harei]